MCYDLGGRGNLKAKGPAAGQSLVFGASQGEREEGRQGDRASFSKCGPRPAAPASPGNFLEMQIVSSHLRSTDWRTLGMGPRNLCFNEPSW